MCCGWYLIDRSSSQSSSWSSKSSGRFYHKHINHHHPDHYYLVSRTDVSSTVFAVIIRGGDLSSQTKPYSVINAWIVLLAVVMIVNCDNEVGVVDDNDDEESTKMVSVMMTMM